MDDAQSSGNYDLVSKNKLVDINFGSTALAIPNMQGAVALQGFSQTYNRGGTTNPLTSGSNYLFANCSALTSLSFYATNLGAINFPTGGFTNTSLTDLDLRYTSIKGGQSGDESEVIKQSTFANCPNLTNIYIDSPNLLEQEICSLSQN